MVIFYKPFSLCGGTVICWIFSVRCPFAPKAQQGIVRVSNRRELVVINIICVCVVQVNDGGVFSQNVPLSRATSPHFPGRIVHIVMGELSVKSWENCPKGCSTV